MAKLRFGRQTGASEFNLDVVTSGQSETEIEVGSQGDVSKRTEIGRASCRERV